MLRSNCPNPLDNARNPSAKGQSSLKDETSVASSPVKAEDTKPRVSDRVKDFLLCYNDLDDGQRQSSSIINLGNVLQPDTLQLDTGVVHMDTTVQYQDEGAWIALQDIHVLEPSSPKPAAKKAAVVNQIKLKPGGLLSEPFELSLNGNPYKTSQIPYKQKRRELERERDAQLQAASAAAPSPPPPHSVTRGYISPLRQRF
ncbi:MAG: hypothetical protein Q9201_004137 [Fulgogasparrea decipioides]